MAQARPPVGIGDAEAGEQIAVAHQSRCRSGRGGDHARYREYRNHRVKYLRFHPE
jgi:hypothetical protein